MLLVQNLSLSGRIHGWPTPSSAPPHTFSTFAEGLSPAPSGFSIVAISQEQKAKIGFFTETLAESVNGGMNLLSYRKYEANSCWICFCLIPRQDDKPQVCDNRVLSLAHFLGNRFAIMGAALLSWSRDGVVITLFFILKTPQISGRC